LGTWDKLSSHEALVAEGAREIVLSNDWLVPRIGGTPWLEKPPLSHWVVASLGKIGGRVDEGLARFPSALAVLVLGLVITRVVSRRLHSSRGTLAGLCLVTSAWAVSRGRLADCDMLLASLVGISLGAFDELRWQTTKQCPMRKTVFAFYAALGALSLVKGIVFGSVLVLSVVLLVLLWDRDRTTLRRLLDPLGIALALGVTLAWPLSVIARYPEALSLWREHLLGRLGSSRFAGESLWEYGSWPFVAGLPWTPMVLIGAVESWRRARSGRFGCDRLLWAWFCVPIFLVSISAARNSHYLLPALAPTAFWAALGMVRIANRLELRGISWPTLKRYGIAGYATIALGWGAGYLFIGPRLAHRGKSLEWSFCERVARERFPGEPIFLVYDAPERVDCWDRAPYPTPWGAVPPDLAPRLFYLNDARVGLVPNSTGSPPAFGSEGTLVAIARRRDRAALERLGPLAVVAEGPNLRYDRAFVAYRVRSTRSVANSVNALNR
jgi:4-amino-4-deoxy-L-arabinose transferase-like glycosyltransferase